MKVSSDVADESMLTFSMNGELGLLGMINGILVNLTGKVLVADADKETGEILEWSIKDKWW